MLLLHRTISRFFVIGRWALPLLLLALTACGYHLENPEISGARRERLYIELFTNQSSRAFINDTLTTDVVTRFSRSGCFDITEDRSAADLILSGSITRYDASPIAYNRLDSITAYRVEIGIHATLRRVTEGGRILWRGDLISGKDYAAATDRLAQQVTERSAGNLVSERLSNDLYARIVDEFDWPNLP